MHEVGETIVLMDSQHALLLSQLHRRVVILERALVLLSARCGDQELSETLVALALDANDPDATGVLYGMARVARKNP